MTRCAQGPTAGRTLDEVLLEELRHGPYGRCIYRCDNDVVDHQVVSMRFAGGATATFTMSAFTAKCYRSIKVMGTMGEIEGDMDANVLYLRKFGQPEQVLEQVDAMEDVKEMALAYHDQIVPAMAALRKPVDEMELLVDKSIWPVPTYGDLMFEV